MPDIKDDRTLSWYHLASPAPRGSRPLGVQAYACAMTGAPVAAYTEPVVGARLRNHVQRGLRTPSHQAGALFDGRPGLLFSSLPLRCYAAMDTVYVSFRPPSTTNFAQNPELPRAAPFRTLCTAPARLVQIPSGNRPIPRQSCGIVYKVGKIRCAPLTFPLGSAKI